MQQTFHIDAGQIDAQIIERILIAAKARFGNRELRLTLDDAVVAPIDQKELYKNSLELQELFKDVVVPAGMNLSDLANEVNL